MLPPRTAAHAYNYVISANTRQQTNAPATRVTKSQKKARECVIIRSDKRKGERKMSELRITKDNFEKEIINSELPVLLDFWAPWCGSCRMIAPVIVQVAEKYAGKAKVGKVNVDEENDLAAALGIVSIPTLVVLKGGKVVSRATGFRSEADIAAMLGVN